MSNPDPTGQPAPRPGWYLDPIDHARERFWDGRAWTHQLRPIAPGVAAPTARPQLAGWWQRVAANLMDGLVILALTLLAGAPLLPGLLDAFQGWYSDAWYAATVGREMPDYTDPKYGIIDAYATIFLINRAVGFAYSTALQTRWGATLGMRALGLRVVPLEASGRPRGLPLLTAVIRNGVFQVAGLFWLAQLVNCLAPLANQKRQALHDMPARTQVVRTR